MIRKALYIFFGILPWKPKYKAGDKVLVIAFMTGFQETVPAKIVAPRYGNGFYTVQLMDHWGNDITMAIPEVYIKTGQ